MRLLVAILIFCNAMCWEAAAENTRMVTLNEVLEGDEDFPAPVLVGPFNANPVISKGSTAIEDLNTASDNFFTYVTTVANPTPREIARLQGQVKKLAYALIHDRSEPASNRATAFVLHLRVLLAAATLDEAAYLTQFRDSVDACRAALPGSTTAAWADAILFRFELKTYSVSGFFQKITDFVGLYPSAPQGPFLVIRYSEFLSETDTAAAKQIVEDCKVLFPNSVVLQNYAASLDQVGTAVVVSVPTLSGGQFRLEDYLGKVVVISFWATWSSRSTALTASLVQLYSDFQASGLEILSSSLDIRQSDATDYIALNGMTWPQVYLPTNQERSAFSRQFSSRGVPKLVVIGKDGKQATPPFRTFAPVRGAVETEILK